MSFPQDIRFALRSLRRVPGFTVVALLTLALGIGANSAVFSVVNATLLRPLPFRDAERLVVVWENVRATTVERRSASYPDYLDWRAQTASFEELAAISGVDLTLSGMEEPELLVGEMVTPSYFPLLGVAPLLGRTFLVDSARFVEDARSVILGHGLWQRRFGGDPGVVGRVVTLNDQPYTVIGVARDGFRGVTADAQAWVAMASDDSSSLTRRGNRGLTVIARLRPGITVARAQADMDAISSRLEAAYPETNSDRGAEVVDFRQDYFGDLRPALLVILAAVAFVLLIACANIANLLLARGAVRGKEIAIRSALGAGRGRIARQLLTESVLLSMLGGAAGVLVAVWAIPLLLAVAPLQLPPFVQIGVDGGVLAFTLLLSLVTGLVFGAVPAIEAAGGNRIDLLREAGRSSGSVSGRRRVRTALVAAEVAIAVVLLIGAGLMLRSFQGLLGFNPGFRTENMLTLRLSLSPERYSTQAARSFHANLLQRVEALPSVTSAALASDIPLGGGYSAFTINIEGREPQPPYDGVRVFRHTASPGLFRALGTPLVAGREFTWQDVDTIAPVVIVSQSLARRYWPGEDPIGKRLKRGRMDGPGVWHTVVGVVGDVKYRELLEPGSADPDIYLPLPTYPARNTGMLVRTSGDPTAVVGTLRAEIASLDPGIPLWDIATMNDRASQQRSQARFSTLLLLGFAGLALVLSGIGIFGVISYSVAQRTHEMGVRLALGAGRRDVLGLIIKEGMAPALGGLLAGLVGALLLTRLMTGMLYQVSATDPATYAVVAVFLSTVALLATYVPGRRVTRVDPVIALRND
ncbi:MAG TPA: ABC transporter permease [Gemmatimonadaceae bacterium]|nr:ABC transporter permease [Gemmatimonadaceae bacterium]